VEFKKASIVFGDFEFGKSGKFRELKLHENSKSVGKRSVDAKNSQPLDSKRSRKFWL
jgi:hypothetical protein